MTNVVFDNLKGIIQNNKNVTKMQWYDGTKYIDSYGNWFGWTDCGYHESLFYAGELWTRTFNANGEPTEPEKRVPIIPHQPLLFASAISSGDRMTARIAPMVL